MECVNVMQGKSKVKIEVKDYYDAFSIDIIDENNNSQHFYFDQEDGEHRKLIDVFEHLFDVLKIEKPEIDYEEVY